MTSSASNPMERLHRALSSDDRTAFEIMLGALLRPTASPAWFTHGDVTEVEGSDLVETPVSIDRSSAHISVWPYEGEVAIKYRRVKLSDLISRYGDVVRHDLPASRRQIMAAYFSSRGLHDRADQIKDGPVLTYTDHLFEVDGSPFLLEGSCALVVKPIQRALAAVVRNTKVDGFRLTSHLSQSAKALLVSQIQTGNSATLPNPLNPALISMGDPVVLNGYRYDNTAIRVTAVGDDFYQGSVDITYSRYDFGWVTGGNQVEVSGPRTPTLQYILQQVSAITGVSIAAGDVVSRTFPTQAAGTVSTYTIEFDPASVKFVGELTVDYRAQ